MSDNPDDRLVRLRSALDAHADHRRQVAAAFAPLVAMGTEILKALLLINAGAGAATLAFVASTLDTRPALALALVIPLAAFGFGLTVAGCATGWSYLAHEQQARSLEQQERSLSEPFILDTEPSRAAGAQAAKHRRLGQLAVFVSIASAILGFAAAGAVMLIMIR